MWVGADATGQPTLSVQPLLLAKPGGRVASQRYLRLGGQVYTYDATRNVITVAPEARETPSWVLPNAVFDGAGIAQYLAVVAHAAPAHVRLLARAPLTATAWR